MLLKTNNALQNYKFTSFLSEAGKTFHPKPDGGLTLSFPEIRFTGIDDRQKMWLFFNNP